MHNFASKTQRFRAVLQLRSMSLSNLLNVNQKNEKKKKGIVLLLNTRSRSE